MHAAPDSYTRYNGTISTAIAFNFTCNNIIDYTADVIAAKNIAIQARDFMRKYFRSSEVNNNS